MLDIIGNYTQTSTGAINIEIGGLTEGTEFDRVNVSGTAALAGTLTVTIINDFSTSFFVGDTFLALNGITTSDFDTVNLQDLPRGLGWHRDNGTITLTVEEVPILDANSSLSLHQDPADGATGVKLNLTRVFDNGTGQDVTNLLGRFDARLTYDGNCLNIKGVRATDFAITDLVIDDTNGLVTFSGSASSGAAAPAILGHVLTRLVGSNQDTCNLAAEVINLKSSTQIIVEVIPPSQSLELRRGNARADNAVSIADALFIAQYLVGSRQACTDIVTTGCLHSVNAAGVRPDGTIDRNTIADALFIAQFLVGLRDEFYNLVP